MKARRTETMIAVSRVSRKVMKNTCEAKVSLEVGTLRRSTQTHPERRRRWAFCATSNSSGDFQRSSCAHKVLRTISRCGIPLLHVLVLQEE